MTLQDLIASLSRFWGARGCLIQQPLDTEVGAGHACIPRRFCACLGRVTGSVAYVQPSRRPADGRFGENPNRLFKHHQFQVILKPSPDAIPRRLYLDSLRDLRHRPGLCMTCGSRKTTGNRPPLGPGGSAGRCCSMGMEITQFTYFQQAGGVVLSPGLRRAHLRARTYCDASAGEVDERLRPGVGVRCARISEVRHQRRGRADEVRVRSWSTCRLG